VVESVERSDSYLLEMIFGSLSCKAVGGAVAEVSEASQHCCWPTKEEQSPKFLGAYFLIKFLFEKMLENTYAVWVWFDGSGV
jgi:hypothetical protein